MLFTQNFKKPETKATRTTDVDEFDDPTIPEEEKMRLANQKRSENTHEDDSLDKQPAPPNPHDKLSLAYLTNLVTAIAKKVNSLSDDMLDLKTAVNLQQSNIANFTEITKNNYHNIERMEKEMQNFFDVKIATETTQKILEAMKIKWDLTYSPLTQEDVCRQMETSPFKEEYTILNNIISEISQLKMTVENKMEDLQKNPGSSEYQDLYVLGQTLERIFNVWPPKLKYFAANKDRSIEIQMEEALRIDISAALSEAEAEKQIEEIMK